MQNESTASSNIPEGKGASNWGAYKADWEYLSSKLGLQCDLLPVICNPNAKISPRSKIRSLGKVPSQSNAKGFATGIADWTSIKATDRQIKKWSSDPDLGICLQTREVRAADIDVEDTAKAEAIVDFIQKELGIALPKRFRSNTGKCLLAFRVKGEFAKEIVKVDGGIIEWLANGQQFVAYGTHSSGVRIEWDFQEHINFPEITPDQYQALKQAVAREFGTAPSSVGSVRKKGEHIEINDPIAAHLIANNHVIGEGRDKKLYIECPWKSYHSCDSGDSETVYFPAGTNGYQQGKFKCLHAGCADRTQDEFAESFGCGLASDFDVIQDDANKIGVVSQKDRFKVMYANDFAAGKPPVWIIKNILPQAGLAMLYGESGAGKTFFIIDLVMSITRGTPWRGHKVKQGTVVYIAAEGVGGFRKRLRAYAKHYGIDLARLPLGIIADAPNLLKDDYKILSEQIVKWGDTQVIVIDTLAQATPGANENAAEDMGLAIDRCKRIHEATGALVILIHHSGKNAERGARGWSGIKAALDTEIEITRGKDGDGVAHITKQKDGEGGKRFPFRLQPVPLDIDEDGEIITSCIVEALDAAVLNVKKPSGKWQKNVYYALHELSSLNDGPIAVDAIITKAIEREPHDPGADPKKPKRDSRRDSAKRALGELETEGLARIENNLVSIPQIRNSSQKPYCGRETAAGWVPQNPQHPIGVQGCGPDVNDLC